MKAHLLLCVAAAASLAVATPTLAGHGGGGGGGGMMKGSGAMGMSSGTPADDAHGQAVRSHASFGTHHSLESHMNGAASAPHSMHASTHGSSSLSANTRAASILGNLNAAHSSAMALQHASSHSIVGAISTYRTSMNNALALTNATDRTNAIIAARQQLALRSNKQLTPTAITRVDGMIGISGADPTLGTTP